MWKTWKPHKKSILGCENFSLKLIYTIGFRIPLLSLELKYCIGKNGNWGKNVGLIKKAILRKKNFKSINPQKNGFIMYFLNNKSKIFSSAKPIVSRVKALRLCRDDFEVLKVIGRGSFGEVAVVRLLNTDKVKTQINFYLNSKIYKFFFKVRKL